MQQTLIEAFDKAGHVDHVFVTAGGTSGLGPLTELSADVLRATFGTRAPAAFAAARVVAARLPAGGSLTLSSGTLVVRTSPGMPAGTSPGMPAGPAAAGAVEALTRAVAVELAPARVCGNATRFGKVDTPLLRSMPEMESDEAVAAAGSAFPLGRFGPAEEAAAPALFLVANNYMTGQIITVDGGETMG